MCHVCCTVFIGLALFGQPHDLRIAPGANATQVEVSVTLPKETAAQLPAGKVTQEDGEKHLQLSLVTAGKDGPVMLGSYRRDGQKLLFTPRFPLQPEQTYRASYLLAGVKAAVEIYTVPARKQGPAAEVVALWPTNDVLPANQLRFYIQFSRPMRGGADIFQQLQILDANGKVIDDPWLPDELWSEDGTLLTLYIHPGRIKWGVLLRWLLGPVLEPDKSYTFVVGGDMLDADGRKLAKEFRKKFRTTAEDRTRLELSAWKLEAPRLGQRAPLTLTFPKAMDRYGLERFLKVVDAGGKAVSGKVGIGRDGRTWTFTPDASWTDREHTIVIDRQLEDVAGNNPVHAFDVDADAPVPPPQRLSISFRPKRQTRMAPAAKAGTAAMSE